MWVSRGFPIRPGASAKALFPENPDGTLRREPDKEPFGTPFFAPKTVKSGSEAL